MTSLHIHLFGRLQIHNDALQPLPLEGRKVQELFSFLLLHRDYPCSREQIADLLWPKCPASQSRAYLRKALWQLHHLLISENSGVAAALETDNEWIQLHTHDQIWLDTALLESVYLKVKGIRGNDLDDATAETVRQVLEWYRGDLLEGWYQDWCVFSREQYQRLYLELLDKLTLYYETQGAYETGIEYATRILAYDPAHERTHRRLMHLYHLNGDRTTALRQFKRCVTMLEQALGAGPDELTTALYEEIRDEGTMNPAMVITRSDTTGEVPPIQEILHRLRQFDAVLIEMRAQVRSEMKQVERLVRTQA